MPSLAQGIQFGGLRNNNLLVTGVVFVLVISLFFIPEIIGFHQSSSTDAPVEEPAEEQSAFSYFLDEDSEQTQVDEPAGRERAALGRKANLLGDDVAEPELSDDFIEQVEEDELPYFPNGEGVTWEMLRKAKVRRHISKARKESRKILATVPPDYTRTRFALLNYVGSLTHIAKGGKRMLEASEVVPFLEELDRSVTAAMLSEGVDRGAFLRWKEVSLGPALQSSVAQRMKQQYEQPYRPQITLSDVTVIQAPDSRGRWVPERPTSVRFRGYVVGTDTELLELYRDGQFISKLRLKKKADRFGRRFFKMNFDRNAKNAIYSIRAVDLIGSVVEKNYVFFPRVLRFRWLPRRGHGRFDIPFSEFDPRIDRAFHIGTRRPTEEQQAEVMFTTF